MSWLVAHVDRVRLLSDGARDLPSWRVTRARMPKQEEPMTTSQDVQNWRGLTAVDADGEKVGTIDEVYLDRGSDAPEWLTVRTGLFGTRTSFVPIGDAQV